MSVKLSPSRNLLFGFNHPSITAFTLRFRNIHAFTTIRSRFLDLPDQHPLAPLMLKRYAAREAVPLWWDCIAKRAVGQSDRVVRSWLARRIRNAFKESLNQKGYDANGRPLPGSGNQAALFGTASFSVQREATTRSFADLVRETDIVVSYIQKNQGNPSHTWRKSSLKQPTPRTRKLTKAIAYS